MIISKIELDRTRSKTVQLARIAMSTSYGMHQVLWTLFPDNANFLYRERGSVFYVLSDVEPSSDGGIFSVRSKPFDPHFDVGSVFHFDTRVNPTIKRRREGRKNSARHDVLMDERRRILLETAGESEGRTSRLRKLALDGLYRDDRSVKERLTKAAVENGISEDSIAEHISTDPAAAIALVLNTSAEKSVESWIERKGRTNGFELIPDVAPIVTERYTRNTFSRNKSGPKGSPITFWSIDVHGALRVTDSDAFSKMLERGIGSSRAFGCGLVLLQRVWS